MISLYLSKYVGFLSMLLVLVSSCAPKIASELKEPEIIPTDYWMTKRSHSILGFDQQAYFQGIEEVNNLKREKAGGPDVNQAWRLEGPTEIGGRVDVIRPLHRGSDTLFCGAANGGVFRSIDGGLNWMPVFDDYSYFAIGAIAVDPSDEQTVYAGTGDRNFGGGSYNGNGVYRSTDMGDTWTHIGLSAVGIVSSIIVHDQSPSTIIVGALGSGFAKTTDRGVYKSTDGGVTWNNTLFVSDSSGVCELIADPTDNNILYACSFNRLNLPSRSIARGPDAKIFKSTDAGSTWIQLTNGLPLTDNSRVGITVSESNPNKLYALYVGTDYEIAEIYVSNDAGLSWTGININSGMNGLTPNVLGGFGWYFGRIHVNPFDENHIVIPGVDQFQSFDGGANWTINVPDWWTYEVHADKHELIFQDSNTFIIGTDGGIYKSEDLGLNWEVLGELPITQFYRVNAQTFSNGVYAGGAQDNGTTSGNYLSSWGRDFGGDGFQSYYVDVIDEVTYFETQRGNIYYTSQSVGVEQIGVSAIDPNENTNWNTPYEVFDDHSVLAGSSRLLYMDNPPFDNWVPLSTNLTLSGVPGSGVPVDRYHTITELGQNPSNENEILVGTSDGLVWKGNRQQGINNWTNISTGLPANYVTSVNYSKRTANKFYVTLTGYYPTLSTPYIFKTEDGGVTWEPISSNLPPVGINDLVTYDRDNNEFLFIATDAGVFVSDNDGVDWDLLGTGLPTVNVEALDINPADQRLIAGTYGRSMWSYDISWALGVKSKELDVLMYPNPAVDHITMSENAKQLVITNLSGSIVLQKENLLKGMHVSIESLPSGMYHIRIDDKVGKLQIQH